MKNNNLTYILLGVGAGLAVYYVMCNRFKKKIAQQEPMSNAEGGRMQCHCRRKDGSLTFQWCNKK